MWDGLTTIIHVIVVTALSLVGVSVESAPGEPPREELSEDAAMILDAPVVWRVDPAALAVPAAPAAVKAKECAARHDQLRALVERGVPVLLRGDDITS